MWSEGCTVHCQLCESKQFLALAVLTLEPSVIPVRVSEHCSFCC